MLYGLMQDRPLMISDFLRYAARWHGDREIVTRLDDGSLHRQSYAQTETRCRRLAKALIGYGIAMGERVGTLSWNTWRHFECFYGVSGMGAVLHTVNPRLFEDQIAYIINHAEDRLLFVDLDFLPLVAKLMPQLQTVEQVIGLGAADQVAAVPDTAGLPKLTDYESFLARGDEDFDWPSFDERAASSLCYTSGTTGNPKGVLYSHRSSVIHAFGVAQAGVFGFTPREVVLPIAPMYHANAWSMPYVVPMAGAKLVLPGRHPDPATIQALVEAEAVTFTAAVPTVWFMMLDYLDRSGKRLDSLERTAIGGTAVPLAMKQAFRERYGVEVLHLWGMTETSPLGTIASPTPETDAMDEAAREATLIKQGRMAFGIDMKLTGENGQILPHDGATFGDLWVRGPWVASGYFKGEGGDKLDADGWFPTGDVSTIDPAGYMKITDRTKDVIKSGGEWISSIDIENLACGHPAVSQAAVIAAFHPKWDERPVLILLLKEGQSVTAAEMLDYLRPKIAKWWLPDDVVIVSELPYTATGKIKKSVLRDQYWQHLTGGQKQDQPS